ncbi:MAG: HAMP domain-containing sensor histidine kinase [Peptoniphilaceae bacterium]|nr:HAMP domain-containing sensor histidine kinase [Peptoniphilaceae bacterium]MDY3738743.1 HAMP domain-containing sensor histidine kinase [Peptoniphilaceae bacterium]
MSLLNKFIKNYMTGILICIPVFAFILSFLINYNIKSFLINNKKNEIYDLKINIEELLKNNSTESAKKVVDEISSKKNIYIKVKDLDNNIILENSEIKNKKIRKNIYNFNLIENNKVFAKMKVEYANDPYKYDIFTENLRKNIVNSLLVSLLFSVVFGIFLSEILSSHLIKPFIEIKNFSNDLKNGKYNKTLPPSKINEINELNDNLNYLSENLKDQNEIRKRYGQDIAHELRTPLTNIKLNLEAIKDGIIPANEKNIDNMILETDRLSSLIKKLRKSYNDNNIENEISIEYFNVSDVLEQIIFNFKAKFTNKNISIIKQINKNVFTYSSKDDFIQIITNLLENAIKASNENGKIFLSLKENKKDIQFVIEDNGIGIKKENLKYIFDRFYTTSEDRNTKLNSHGLGLSIVKNKTNLIHGTISVESEINKGTKFTLIFPKKLII